MMSIGIPFDEEFATPWQVATGLTLTEAGIVIERIPPVGLQYGWLREYPKEEARRFQKYAGQCH